ncbi:MAG: hypothetical protein ABSC92_18750 [Rhizomicrobium sp.]
MHRGEFFHHTTDGGVSHFSIAFENVGSGVAAIAGGARVRPSLMGDVYVSRKFVPVGQIVRVNVSVLRGGRTPECFSTQWWAMDGIEIEIDYTDTNGGDPLTSRAVIRQYVTQGPCVQEITVFRKSDGVELATGKSSY